MHFISVLLDFIFPPRDTEALVREATLEDITSLVQPRQHRVGPYTATSLLPYRHPLVRALILEAKFRGNTRAHHLLGLVLREALHEVPDVIVVPIPLGRKRMRERGYNQVEEIVRRSGLPVRSDILFRTRETSPQTELTGRERCKNMEGAFTAQSMLPGVHYLLIDDVLTTGTTLGRAAATLAARGAHEVRLVALAG